MNTYEPMMTNAELKTLCGLVSKEVNTPLRQARLAIQAIQMQREQYQPKSFTPAEREHLKSLKRSMGLNPWQDLK